MYAVEFQATIENSIVHIPKEYKDLREKRKKKMSAISIDTIDGILHK